MGTRPPTEDEFLQYEGYHRRRLNMTPGPVSYTHLDVYKRQVQEIIDLANVVEEGGTLKDGESLN